MLRRIWLFRNCCRTWYVLPTLVLTNIMLWDLILSNLMLSNLVFSKQGTIFQGASRWHVRWGSSCSCLATAGRSPSERGRSCCRRRRCTTRSRPSPCSCWRSWARRPGCCGPAGGCWGILPAANIFLRQNGLAYSKILIWPILHIFRGTFCNGFQKQEALKFHIPLISSTFSKDPEKRSKFFSITLLRSSMNA
jgi:hypothetical protein